MAKFKVGDRVRRINWNNNWSDGTRLRVGDIVTVVKINSIDDMSVDINGKIKSGNDPNNFELVMEEPTPTPIVNVTVNLYENACWYCRKGGLVDLYLAGQLGICPSCGRVCNNTTPTTPKNNTVIEFKPAKKNEPLTTEELKALSSGTRVFVVKTVDGVEQLTDIFTCWRTVKNNELSRKGGFCWISACNKNKGTSYHVYLEKPEGAVDSGA